MEEIDSKAQTVPSALSGVFDPRQQFRIKVISGGEKWCVLRFPTDAEWCEYARRLVTVRKTLGRGRSVSENQGAERANRILFDAIRVETDGVEFDDADAGYAISKLERATVEAVTRAGDQFEIELRILKGRSKHILRMPTQREIKAHDHSSTSLVNVRRAQEIRAFLEPSGALYDKLNVAPPSQIPVSIVHKAAAVGELLYQFTELDEEEDDAPE